MNNLTCFMIGPIGTEGTEVRRRSDALYEHVIRPAAQEQGYTVIRADQIASPGSITSQIINRLLESDLAIADLTGLNPNVMYELGIRHAAGKPVIQIISERERIPFDVSTMRTIFVDVSDLGSVGQARSNLSRTIRAIHQDALTAGTPISEAANVARFERIDEADKQDGSLIISVLKDIESRLGSLEQRLAQTSSPSESKRQYSRRVFLVHGHDGELKNELARLLERLNFQPIILHERPDRGQTLIGKLTGEMADIGFAFVLLTPDDVGAMVAKREDLNLRARQNVVFEHGLFVSHLTPQRVCAIRRGDVEIPSDLQGILYKTVSVGSGISSIALEIVNELRAAGYVVDANRLLEE